MAPPKTLDELVKNVDFRNLQNVKYCCEVESMVSQIRHQDHTRKNVEDAFKGLVKYVARKDMPNDKSVTIRAMERIFYKLGHAIMDAQDGKGGMEHYTYADMVPQLKELFFTCLKYGPTLGHFAILDHVIRSYKLDKNFIKIARGKDAKEIFEALKCTYNTDIPEAERKDYTRRFAAFYDDMFGRVDINSNEAMVEYSPWMAELFSYYMKQMVNSDSNSTAEIYKNIAVRIYSQYKSKHIMPDYLYCHLDDPQILVNHLKEFMGYVKNETFAKHECCKGIARDWGHLLITPLAGQVPYAFDNVQLYADLTVTLENSKLETLQRYSYSAINIFNNTDAEITKKAAISCKDLAAKIRDAGDAPISRWRIWRDLTKGAVGQKFTTGIVEKDAFELLVAMINTADGDNMYCVTRTLQDSKKVKWKDHGEDLRYLLNAVIDTAIDTGFLKDRGFSDIATWVAETAEKQKIIKVINGDLIRGLVEALKHPKEYRNLHAALCRNCSKIDWKIDMPRLHEVFQAHADGLRKDGKCLMENESDDYMSLVRTYLSNAQKHLSDTKRAGEFTRDIDNVLSTMLGALQDAVEEDDDFRAKAFTDHISTFSYLIHQLSDKPEHIRPLVPIMLKISEAGIDGLSEPWSVMFSGAGRKQPAVLADYVPRLIALSFNAEPHLGAQFPSVFLAMYPHGAEHFHDGIYSLLQYSKSNISTGWPLMIIQLTAKIAGRHPKVLTSECLTLVIDMMDLPHASLIVYDVIEKVALHHPEKVMPVLDPLVTKAYEEYPEAQPHVIRTISSVGKLKKSEAAKRMTQLLDLMTETLQPHQVLILQKIQELGSLFPTLLPPHKEQILSIKLRFPHVAEICKSIVDVIEGRSLAGLSEDVEEQKADLEVVKTDVSDTKQKVDDVSTKVDEQGRDLKHVQEDVTKVEERLDVVEETVDDTVQKVEEVDRKTMTNAPAWSRDVSLLLNPESDRDWRLLGQRLGYSKNDIRGWATQHDPCMAVLSEWYATHKTREATHGVLKALEEMNREDAAEIVRKAKEEGDAVLEEEEVDSGPLPPVFLSYQWGHQPHVKLFKRHLEKAGFRCWMDTGQMGGGDKLFAKIDAGMRAATVIICCVSEKYAKSDNCTREVNLAVNLGKPIIPLLMEKMKWPPEGAMGPIFGEYLFIRFNQRSGEETGDERFWPAAKFEELIMQLRYSIVPDESMITEEYREWWNPKEEQIVIPRTSENRAISEVPTEHPQEQTQSPEPEVFLSYQWGKQTQIKALFTRLTSLGYSCWMDIHQMGGGDSLYEKIDKGVRNAKVVVCCVTPKYALSANCRREVSLADALKKPIIPLLLDKMTWPPEGSMSMVMTQLLYIVFGSDPMVQMKWTGDKMNELMQRIDQFVSQTQSKGILTASQMTKPTSTKSQNVRPDHTSAKPTSSGKSGMSKTSYTPHGHSTVDLNKQGARPKSGAQKVKTLKTEKSFVRSDTKPKPATGKPNLKQDTMSLSTANRPKSSGTRSSTTKDVGSSESSKLKQENSNAKLSNRDQYSGTMTKGSESTPDRHQQSAASQSASGAKPATTMYAEYRAKSSVNQDATKSVVSSAKQDTTKPVVSGVRHDTVKPVVSGVRQDTVKPVVSGVRQDTVKPVAPSVKPDTIKPAAPGVKSDAKLSTTKRAAPSEKLESAKSVSCSII